MTSSEAGEVYRQLAPAVLGYLRASRAHEPEDLLGEIFLQVARDIHRFKGDDDDRRRWVFTIARHRLIDARRSQARRPQLAEGDIPDAPASTSTSGPIDPELLRALEYLTPEQREVVVLRFVADLSLEAVAKLTKRNANSVKALQHRGLSRLARILGGLGDADEDDD